MGGEGGHTQATATIWKWQWPPKLCEGDSPSGSISLVLLLTWAWPWLDLSHLIPRTCTDERKIMKLPFKTRDSKRDGTNLDRFSPCRFSPLSLHFTRFYSSYLLLSLIAILKKKVKQEGVRNKQNRKDLVKKVQTVLFLSHGPTLKVFHCQGYKQLFTSTSGWEYCISSQGHYFVCLGMQTL